MDTNANSTKVVNYDTSHVVSIVIDDDHTNGKKSNTGQPAMKEMTKFLSPLYAIMIVITGLMLPMAEVLQDQWLQSECYVAFMVYVFTLSIIFLVYFTIYLMRQPKTSQKQESENINNENNNNTSEMSKNPNEIVGKRDEENTKYSSRQSDGNFVSFKENTVKSTRKINGGMSAKLRVTRSCATLNSAEAERDFFQDSQLELRKSSYINRYSSVNTRGLIRNSDEQISPRSNASNGDLRNQKAPNSTKSLYASMTNLNVDDDDLEQDEGWIDLSKLGNIFSHEGSSLYLRFATLLFGLCNIIYVGLEIENTMVPKVGCKNVVVYGWIFVFRLVFLIIQTFFLFKYPMVEIKQHKLVARFGVMHIIATNICVWLKTLIIEIANEFQHIADEHPENGTESSPQYATNYDSNNTEKVTTLYPSEYQDCDYYMGVLRTLSPYLFPFVLEYSLIAMGTLTAMYVTIIDDNDSDKIARGLHNLFKIQVPAADESDGGSKHEENSESVLRKSHRGLFLGVLVLGTALITIITFYATTDDFQRELLYMCTDLGVHCLMIVATVGAIIMTNRLSYIAKPVMVDDILLVVAMSGSILYEESYIISTSNYIRYQPNSQQELIEIIQLIMSIVAWIQIVLQVVLIASGLRRYPSKHEHINDMPGRGCITFLIVSNVVVWICRTAQAKIVPQRTEMNYYGDMTWILLVNISLPFLLFFQFHSSICLADIWHVAYYPIDAKLKKKQVRMNDKSHTSKTSKTPTLQMNGYMATRPSDRPVPGIVVTNISRSSSLSQLQYPRDNFNSSHEQFPTMLDGIEIVQEAVIFASTEDEEETHNFSF